MIKKVFIVWIASNIKNLSLKNVKIYWNQRFESWEALFPMMKDPTPSSNPIVFACLKCLLVKTPLKIPTKTE